jgi:hypothetical protein
MLAYFAESIAGSYETARSGAGFRVTESAGAATLWGG